VPADLNWNIGIINGVIDCNGSAQTETNTSNRVSGFLLQNVSGVRLENLRIDNARRYAGHLYSVDHASINNLHCTGSLGDGFRFGVSGGWEVSESFIDNIRAENCRGQDIWGDDPQGNPFIGCMVACSIGKVHGQDCAGGIKIQDASTDLMIGLLSFDGANNGAQNSGIKLQGGSTGHCQRITIDAIATRHCYGSGVFLFDCDNISIGSIQSYDDARGLNAAAVTLHSTCSKLNISQLMIDSSNATGISIGGADINIGRLNLRNANQHGKNLSNVLLDGTASDLIIGSIKSIDDQATATVYENLNIQAGASNIDIGVFYSLRAAASEQWQHIYDSGAFNLYIERVYINGELTRLS
jgi:hypothetical protein